MLRRKGNGLDDTTRHARARDYGFLIRTGFWSDPCVPKNKRQPEAGLTIYDHAAEERDAEGMVHYFWSAIVGTPASIGFATRMRNEGVTRFEEVIDEFRVRFDDAFLRRPYDPPAGQGSN